MRHSMHDKEDIFDRFMSKYGARIQDSREYNQYVRTNPYHKDFYASSYLEPYSKVVPMKAVHLTSDSLEQLMRDIESIECLRDDAAYGKKLTNMLRLDEHVRDENPAVQKAYRNYLTLLELARK